MASTGLNRSISSAEPAVSGRDQGMRVAEEGQLVREVVAQQHVVRRSAWAWQRCRRRPAVAGRVR